MVRLTKEESSLEAMERCVDRMLRDSRRTYLAWLDHHYPNLRKMDHETSIEFEASRQALEAHHEQ